MTTVNADDLENAMLLTDEADSEAWVCLKTGKVYVRSDIVGELEPLPDDIDTSDKYIPVPGTRSLDLGQALVFEFAQAHMPDDEDSVRQLFKRAGAYGRFAHLVADRGLTDRWHAFRDQHTRDAMRAWCEENGLQLA